MENVTADELVVYGEIQSSNVLNIDVEEAEYGVLQAMESLFLRAECRLCCLEVHPNKANQYENCVSDIQEFLE